MSNHLGNVLTVINDIKVPYLDGSDVAYYATIVSTADYSPFGVQLDGRTVSAESYRYGFNGMEKDDEMKGVGNSYDFGARILDPRLGRWLTRDPLAAKYAGHSPYCFSINSPILLKDPDGRIVVLFDAQGNKVATISKAGMVVEKGMENSNILHAYLETRDYLVPAMETNAFAEFENSGKILTINESTSITQSASFKPPSDVTYFDDQNKNGLLDDGEQITSVVEDPVSLGTITWNPSIGANDAEGNQHSPALIFGHELTHAKHRKDDIVRYHNDRRSKLDNGRSNLEEKRTIEETNRISSKLYQNSVDSNKPFKKKNMDGGNGSRIKHEGGIFFVSQAVTSLKKLESNLPSPNVWTRDNHKK